MDESPDEEFEPVAVNARHDGWTAEKQAEFLTALSECACVTEACKRVGMSTTSAYSLRRRIDAQSFRIAWEAALDYGIRRLSDAAFSRAINGVSRPIFYQGEQVGERRHYDERLTMFLLRYRDPVRYGAWIDQCTVAQPVDAEALLADRAKSRAEQDAFDLQMGRAPKARRPLQTRSVETPVSVAQEEAARADEMTAEQEADLVRKLKLFGARVQQEDEERRMHGDVP